MSSLSSSPKQNLLLWRKNKNKQKRTKIKNKKNPLKMPSSEFAFNS